MSHSSTEGAENSSFEEDEQTRSTDEELGATRDIQSPDEPVVVTNKPPVQNDIDDEEEGDRGTRAGNRTNAAEDATSDEDEDSTLPPYDNATVQVEVVRPAVLVLNREEARRQMLDDAVSATKVHVIRPYTPTPQSKWKTPLIMAVSVLIVAAFAISLGITLSRRSVAMAPTTSTIAPTSARFKAVAALVATLFGTTLEDPSSSQYQAAQWIADEDTTFPDFATVDADRFVQRYALAVFFFSTGGPTNWTDTSFFLQSGVHECDWWDNKPEETHPFSGFVGIFSCSKEKRVRGLEIRTLPDELGSLSELAILVLKDNNIGGTLPSSLFELLELRTLFIWGNQVTGTIPTEIGGATALQDLAFTGNILTGSVPFEIGNLFNLKEVSLLRNMLTGTIPTTFLQLSNLGYVDLGENDLTGTLPSSLFLSLPNLVRFGISENLLSGSIPGNLDSLSSTTGRQQLFGAISFFDRGIDQSHTLFSFGKRPHGLPSN